MDPTERNVHTRARAAGWDTDQRAGESIEHEDNGADQADGGGQAQVELVVHVGPLKAVGLSAHDSGDVDDVKHRHGDELLRDEVVGVIRG